MSELILKEEMSDAEFEAYKKENINGKGFKMSKNPAGDMFFMENGGTKAIFVYKWVGGYMVQVLN